MTNTGYCLSCHGKGGSYVQTIRGRRWIRCGNCNAHPTSAQAKQATIDRYVYGNRNPAAWNAARRAGATEEELHASADAWDAARQSLLKDQPQ